MSYCFSTVTVKSMGYEMVKENNIKTLPSWERAKVAGVDERFSSP